MPLNPYLAELALSVDRLGTLALQPSDVMRRPVPACPGWTLDELYGHLGSIERWAASIVRQGNFLQQPDPPAQDKATWFLEGAQIFLHVMAEIDPEMPCWAFGPEPGTARFWLRRQAHEHALHLLDACRSSGAGEYALPEDFMLDGVDEVLGMFAPRQIRLGRMPEPGAAVTFHVPGAHSWTLGQGRVKASVTAPARSMYLGLWGRTDLTHAAAVEGDTALVAQVLNGALTP